MPKIQPTGSPLSSPPTQGQASNTAPVSGRSGPRHVSPTPPNGQHSVRGANPGNGGPVASGPSRSAAPAAGDPAQQMKALQGQMKQLMSNIWVRDQLSITQEILADPSLAKQMGITIQVQPPGAKAPVQIFPPLVGKGAISTQYRARCIGYLSQESQHIAAQLNRQQPAQQLFGEYVNCRTQIVELAESMGAPLDWPQLYDQLRTSAFDQTLTGNLGQFRLCRGPYDPNQKLSSAMVDELNRKARGEPPKKNNKPKKKGLDNPQIEFRVKASPGDLQRFDQNLSRVQPHR